MQSKPQGDHPSSNKAHAVVEKDKGKAIIDVELLEDKGIQVQPRRPKNITEARKEKHEKLLSPPEAHKDINDSIAAKVE